MKEIKFRVWNKIDRKMYKPDSKGIIIEINGDNQFWIKDTKYLQEWSLGNNLDCNLMQFTGLRDVNGKEIYEGDIVECEYARTKTINEVKWNLDIVGFDPFCIPCDYDEVYYDKDAIKIIGNIYENPEMLENKKW